MLDKLLRVGSSPNRDQLRDIEGNLNDYNEYGLKLYSLSLLLPIFPSQSPWKNSRSAQDARIKEHAGSIGQPEVKAGQPGEI
jgi:hypothetical protein